MVKSRESVAPDQALAQVGRAETALTKLSSISSDRAVLKLNPLFHGSLEAPIKDFSLD
jgi:hypothetical protein